MKSLFVMAAAATLMASSSGAADIEAGAKVYRGTCAACHGLTGLGAMPGIPNLARRDGPLTLPDSVLLPRVMNGYRSPGSQLPMPPKGGNPSLTLEDAENALAYMRHAFEIKVGAASEPGRAPSTNDRDAAPTGSGRMGGMMNHQMNGGRMMGR